MIPNNIATDAPIDCFSSSHESKLHNYLDQIEKDTVIHTVYSQDQILINDNMCVGEDGYKYTWPAITNIAGRMVYGGHFPVLTLAGHYRDARYNHSHYSASDAAMVFNTMARRRFQKFFKGKKLVKNSRFKLIEGMPIRKHRRLSNLTFLEATTDRLRDLDTEYDLKQAIVNGRHFQLRLTTGDEFEVTGSTVFPTAKLGIAIENNEMFSRNVRGCVFVDLIGYGQIMVGLNEGRRISHSEDFFYELLTDLLTDLSRKCSDFSIAGFCNKLASLEKNKLGLTSSALHSYAREMAIYKFMHINGIPKVHAADILRRTVGYDGDVSSFMEARISKKDRLSKRSHADLLKNMLAVTDESSSLFLRNIMENVAFKLFTKGNG